MKKIIYPTVSFLMLLLLTVAATAQNSLAPDQNPNYMVSQLKYTKMADSINTWHSTTPQETYKAIDYLADKQEARAARRAFRRELRLERARYGGWDYNGYGNGNYYNNYDPGFYNYNYYSPYRGYRGSYRNNWRNNYWWNTVPLATTVGLGLWWCR